MSLRIKHTSFRRGFRVAPVIRLKKPAARQVSLHPTIRLSLRRRLHGMSVGQGRRKRRPTRDTTIPVCPDVTTLINILTVEPENQTKLAELLRDNTDNVVSTLDGWISTSFIAAKDQRRVVIYSQWRDFASVEAMRANPDMVAYFPRIAALARLDSFAGDVVYNHHA